VRLSDLGERIVILGPSGSGKSTLAAAIGAARGLEVVHLDQLRHLPGTHWRPRPDDEFARLHDMAIDGERWVMDGSYSTLLPRRLGRATGLIVTDVSTRVSLDRYLRRTFGSGPRAGGLEGTVDRLSWPMVRWIVFHTREGRIRRRALFDSVDVPKMFLAGVREIDDFYDREQLPHPRA
jgi:adenylate kinase family enzyme